MLPSGGSLCHCYRGSGLFKSLRFSMLHKIIEPAHALPCAAFRPPFARTEVGNDQDSLLFIRHRKFRVQTLPKTSQGSVIHRLEYGGCDRLEVIFFWRFKFIWHARVYLWGHEKLLAMHAGVTSLIKLDKTTDNASFYYGQNHQMARVEKSCCLPPQLLF